MKVFVTGATGYIGSVVAEYLLKAGHVVSALARSDGAVQKLKSLGVEPRPGDLGNAEAIRAAVADADAVIHAAMAWGPETAKLDEGAVRAILDGLKGSRKPFVYTSGAWVMGDTKGRVAAELSMPHPPEFVAWRLAIENLALEAGTVLRPAMVYGRGGGVIGDFVKQARTDRLIKVVGTGENHWSFVHVDALADLYVRAVEQEPRGQMFLAADGPAFTVRIVVDTVAAMNEARVGLWPLEEARKVLGPVADALVLDQRLMSTKAGRMLGWGPKWPSVLDYIRSGVA